MVSDKIFKRLLELVQLYELNLLEFFFEIFTIYHWL